jgi:hypothetical protein
MTLKQPKATGVDTYSSMDQLMDFIDKVKKHLSAPSDTLPEVISHGRAPINPYTPGQMAPKMYGSGVDSNVADKGDRLDLPADPNQTSRPRIGMSGALAEPAKNATPKAPSTAGLTKKPMVKEKKKTKPLTQAEKTSNWITSISR